MILLLRQIILLKKLGISVSDSTIRRALSSSGLKAGKKEKRPFLSKKNIKDRFEFKKRHIHWTISDWESVIWSDETKINRFYSDGKNWCRVWNIDEPYE